MGAHLANAASYTDFSHFAELRTRAREDAGEAISAVSKEFEALFIQLMLKAARDAEIDGGLFNSHELKLYREMMDGQVALAMAEQGALNFEAVLRPQLQTHAPLAPAERELKFPNINPSARRSSAPVSASPGVGHTPINDARPTQRTSERNDGEFPGDDLVFIDGIRPYAQRTAERLGTAPDVLIAQAALETGWGRHVIRHADGRSANNLFGIKADPSWQGSVARVNTLEYFSDKPVRVSAAFRSYDGVEQAFSDYASFLEQNPRYRQALAKGSDGPAFITELARAGYATDPAYARKVLSIAKQIDGMASVTTAKANEILR